MEVVLCLGLEQSLFRLKCPVRSIQRIELVGLSACSKCVLHTWKNNAGLVRSATRWALSPRSIDSKACDSSFLEHSPSLIDHSPRISYKVQRQVGNIWIEVVIWERKSLIVSQTCVYKLIELTVWLDYFSNVASILQLQIIVLISLNLGVVDLFFNDDFVSLDFDVVTRLVVFSQSGKHFWVVVAADKDCLFS